MRKHTREGGELRALADRLHSLAIHLLRAVKIEDSESGLSPARLSALSVIVFAGPLRLGELAEAEGVSPPTMSRIVAALVDAGMTASHTDPSDRRSRLLETTALGRKTLEEARARRLRRLTDELAALTSEQVAAISTAVDALTERFGGAANRERTNSSQGDDD